MVDGLKKYKKKTIQDGWWKEKKMKKETTKTNYSPVKPNEPYVVYAKKQGLSKETMDKLKKIKWAD